MGKKKKVILPPDLPPEIREEEIEVSDEDLEFVRQNREYAGFLTRLDTKSIDRHVIRVADQKEDDLEKLYETRNRKLSLQKAIDENHLEIDPVDALPIKTLDGQLYYRTAKESKTVDIPDEEETATAAKDDSEDKGIMRLTKAERRQKLKKIKKEAKRQAKEENNVDVTVGNPHAAVLAKLEEDLSVGEVFAQKKNKLAEIGISLLEDPESNIQTLKDLLQFCNDENPKVVKLGLLSLLAVFKDIIPGYQIRLPTEKELQAKVSKPVRKIWFYESTLLHAYKKYLLRLLALEKESSFKLVAVRCMCNLLDAVPHFNFWQNLLAGVVKNISSSDDIIRKLCCEAVKSLFVNGAKHGGEATLRAVQLISSHVKAHDCQLHPDCVKVFLSLMFDEDLGRSESKQEEKVKPKKKWQRKNDEKPSQFAGNEKKKSRQELMVKTREEVNADFKSASFVPDPEEQRNIQSQTLAAVFETYFRVLKNTMDPDISRLKEKTAALSGGSVTHPLLGPCLKGLGKFSHLIDLDFMGDIMGCLKKLAGFSGSKEASPENHLSVSERLQCCIVAFKVMRNNLDALNIDLQEFYVHLYSLLLEYRPDRDQGDVLAEALKTMLCEGKQHDMQRAAAFIKRLATFTLCFGPAEAMAALVTIRHLLLKNPKCRNLLENDAGGGSLSGLVVKYHSDASDPNLSGALASVLWELGLLAKHYHPTISSTASSTSRITSHNQVHFATTSPQQAFLELSMEREPFMPTGKPAFLNRKRKRDKGTQFSSPASKIIQRTECPVDEDEVREKMEEHFAVLRDIRENERLRAELNHTSRCISLYNEYKKQMDRKEGSENKRKRKFKTKS